MGVGQTDAGLGPGVQSKYLTDYQLSFQAIHPCASRTKPFINCMTMEIRRQPTYLCQR